MTNLKEATTVLKQGGIVIFPTDTAYGIGCRINNSEAVKRIFKIRKRPLFQATPVLVDSIKMSQNYLLGPLPDNVRLMMKKYWPGALTIVYPCILKKVPSLVRGGGFNLGVRMPNHEIALYLISQVGVPILGPSANFHDQPTPYQFTDIDPKLIKLVDYAIPGKCRLGNVSTVIDCSVRPYKILRQGAINIDKNEFDRLVKP